MDRQETDPRRRGFDRDVVRYFHLYWPDHHLLTAEASARHQEGVNPLTLDGVARCHYYFYHYNAISSTPAERLRAVQNWIQGIRDFQEEPYTAFIPLLRDLEERYLNWIAERSEYSSDYSYEYSDSDDEECLMEIYQWVVHHFSEEAREQQLEALPEGTDPSTLDGPTRCLYYLYQLNFTDEARASVDNLEKIQNWMVSIAELREAPYVRLRQLLREAKAKIEQEVAQEVIAEDSPEPSRVRLR